MMFLLLETSSMLMWRKIEWCNQEDLWNTVARHSSSLARSSTSLLSDLCRLSWEATSLHSTSDAMDSSNSGEFFCHTLNSVIRVLTARDGQTWSDVDLIEINVDPISNFQWLCSRITDPYWGSQDDREGEKKREEGECLKEKREKDVRERGTEIKRASILSRERERDWREREGRSRESKIG